MTSKPKKVKTWLRTFAPGSAGGKPLPQAREELPERRREPRYPTRDPVDVENMSEGGRQLPGLVLDVSRSGLQLELDAPIGKGTKIKITFPAQFIIFGEVCYCLTAGTVFHAGVLIKRVLYSSGGRNRHLQNSELNLLKSGAGMTAAQVMELRKHLMHCKACESRVETAMAEQADSSEKD